MNDLIDNYLKENEYYNISYESSEFVDEELASLQIKNAIDNGYGICVDVRALADNTIIVFHDEALGRLTYTDGFIINCNYSDIADLRLGKTQSKIPTLEEVLETINGQVPLLIDIRNMGKVSFEKHVWKILQNYEGEYAVISANPYSLEWFKINAPKVKRGQVSSFYKNSELPFRMKYSYKRMRYNKEISEPNFIVYKADDLPNRFVKKFKDLPLLAYHVNNQDTYNKIKKHVNNVVFEGFEIQ